MSVVFKSRHTVHPVRNAAIDPAPARNPNGLLPALLCGLALLLIGGPPFLRMPLTNDAVLFDLQARLLSDGSVLYRDILEPNLPGVVWIHRAVRASLGDSSEALRLFDLAVIAGIIALGFTWIRRTGGTPRAATWFVVSALLFYLSISEWCHCQRDMWMLLPSLAALTLRAGWTGRWLDQPLEATTRGTLGSAVLEGLLWGIGVWIKPYVALPGLAAWGVSQVLVRRRRFFIRDTFGLLAGGLIIGGCGSAWLIHSGAWDAFYLTLTEWNPRYFEAGREHWTLSRCIPMAVRLWPWSLLHLIAVPLAAGALWNACRRDHQRSASVGESADVSKTLDHALLPAISAQLRIPMPAGRRWPTGRMRGSHDALTCASPPLLAAFYLAWTAQAFCLQHLFDYVHAPALLIALLFLSSRLSAAMAEKPRIGWKLAACGFLLLAVIVSPVLRSERLQVWSQCVTGSNSPRLQDRLAHFQNPSREDLARVAEFLERHHVRGTDVCCYNSDLVSLYQQLHLQPPTRFVYLHELLVFFPDRRSEIQTALAVSDQRFIVTDLASCGMPRHLAVEIGPDGPLAPPPAYSRFQTDDYPWSHPVVFRSGTYLVHQVEGR